MINGAPRRPSVPDPSSGSSRAWTPLISESVATAVAGRQQPCQSQSGLPRIPCHRRPTRLLHQCLERLLHQHASLCTTRCSGAGSVYSVMGSSPAADHSRGTAGCLQPILASHSAQRCHQSGTRGRPCVTGCTCTSDHEMELWGRSVRDQRTCSLPMNGKLASRLADLSRPSADLPSHRPLPCFSPAPCVPCRPSDPWTLCAGRSRRPIEAPGPSLAPKQAFASCPVQLPFKP
jgi:hypothetical protein